MKLAAPRFALTHPARHSRVACEGLAADNDSLPRLGRRQGPRRRPTPCPGLRRRLLSAAGADGGGRPAGNRRRVPPKDFPPCRPRFPSPAPSAADLPLPPAAPLYSLPVFPLEREPCSRCIASRPASSASTNSSALPKELLDHRRRRGPAALPGTTPVSHGDAQRGRRAGGGPRRAGGRGQGAGEWAANPLNPTASSPGGRPPAPFPMFSRFFPRFLQPFSFSRYLPAEERRGWPVR